MRRELRTYAGAETVTAEHNIRAFDPAIGKMNAHTRIVLLDTIEDVAKVIALTVNRLEQQVTQPIPRSDKLQQRLLRNHITLPVESDPLVDDNANIDDAGSTFVERLQQLQMAGENSDPAPDQFD